MISQQKLMQLEENLKEIESKLFPQKSFNVFDVLKISSYEIRHSNVLTWLFDGKASHQLKYSFLQTFISTIKQNSANNQGRLLIDDSVEVYREFYNIDIVVCSSKQKWVIAIENKINHHETEFQLQNYGSVISEYFKDYDQHYFLLSKNGIISSYPELWKSIGYEEILNILDEITSKFSEKTNSQILEFIDQYKTIIRRDIVKDDKSTRELIEFYYRNKSILDKIYEVIPTESKQYKGANY